jgi:CRISPR-associated protein Cmr3
MMHLLLSPRDPLIARDGRPFGADSGRRMRSQDWLTPSVVAGSLRTMVGKELGTFDPARLKKLVVAGPFPWSDGRLFLPAAGDLFQTRAGRLLPARPLSGIKAGEGTDLPTSLWPVCLPASAGTKFASVPAWWSAERMAEWLITDAPPGCFLRDPCHFRESATADERTHVEIKPDTFTAKDERLFSTTGLVVDRMFSGHEPFDSELAVRVEIEGDPDIEKVLARLDLLHPLGGERRLVRMRGGNNQELARAWACPPRVRKALSAVGKDGGIRMVLATTAVFAPGWCPYWSSPPSAASVRLKLVGVCNQRWRAVSGWSLEAPTGPKAIRRLVPAGGVYFFQLESGPPDALADAWLQPVSDDATDRAEGFGLALWGTWEYAKEE